MADPYWSTVGSAGTASSADLPKLVFSGSIVQLGVGIGGTRADRPAPEAPVRGTEVTAIIRYNVTPFPTTYRDGVGLKVRYRDGSGRVLAKLIAANLLSGIENVMASVDSVNSGNQGSEGFQVADSPEEVFSPDFKYNAYFVELTLSVVEPFPGAVIAFPPAVSIIELYNPEAKA